VDTARSCASRTDRTAHHECQWRPRREGPSGARKETGRPRPEQQTIDRTIRRERESSRAPGYANASRARAMQRHPAWPEAPRPRRSSARPPAHKPHQRARGEPRQRSIIGWSIGTMRPERGTMGRIRKGKHPGSACPAKLRRWGGRVAGWLAVRDGRRRGVTSNSSAYSGRTGSNAGYLGDACWQWTAPLCRAQVPLGARQDLAVVRDEAGRAWRSSL